MYSMYCTNCNRYSMANLSYCPNCGAGTWALRIDPITTSDIVGVSLVAGSMWVLNQYYKQILRPLIIKPLEDLIATAQAKRDITEKLGKLQRMVEAVEAGEYKKVLEIGRLFDIPEYYPDQIRAKYMILLGLAQFAEKDMTSALRSFKEFTRIHTKLNSSNDVIAVGNLLVAEVCYRLLGSSAASNAPLIEQGLSSMNEAIRRLAPQADFYALRALLYCGKGQVGPAKRDAELALDLDPDNSQASKVLEMIRQATDR